MPSFRLNYLVGMLLVASLRPVVLLGQEVKPPSEFDAAIRSGTDPAALSQVVKKIAPEDRKGFAAKLAANWPGDRPEWVEMLISLLKHEPLDFRSGWFQPIAPKYDWKWIAEKLDANKDGLVSRDEMPKDAPYPELIYARLDRDGDGELRSADFDFFSRQPPTPSQSMSRFLSAVLDADSNGRITPEELQNWFKGADKDKAGFLTVDDLLEDFSRAFADLNSGGDEMPGPDKALSMFFRGELGALEAGPKQGDEAPDFKLPTHDGKQTFALSKSRGKPVILIFGSFT